MTTNFPIGLPRQAGSGSGSDATTPPWTPPWRRSPHSISAVPGDATAARSAEADYLPPRPASHPAVAEGTARMRRATPVGFTAPKPTRAHA